MVSPSFSFLETISNFELQSLTIEQICKRLFLEAFMGDMTEKQQ